jgi:predicted adenylyl cyclase CyaB
MKKEIELKFKIENPGLIRKKLRNLKAKFIGKAFEKTIKFDTKNDGLKKQGKFLRVRTGFENEITFKKKINKFDKDFKEREEIEVEISDPEKMEKILENLGFTKKWLMEKYREKWILGNVEVVIDKLPKMGYFIEIEGSKRAIQKTAKILGLDLKKRITETYWGLWKNYCQGKGIKEENIIFKGEKYEKISECHIENNLKIQK